MTKYTAADLDNIIAAADAYIARVPYSVREFCADGCTVNHWDGSMENCKWWIHAEGTHLDAENIDRDTVAIVPNSRYDALCALGYGFDLCMGNIPESLYR